MWQPVAFKNTYVMAVWRLGALSRAANAFSLADQKVLSRMTRKYPFLPCFRSPPNEQGRLMGGPKVVCWCFDGRTRQAQACRS